MKYFCLLFACFCAIQSSAQLEFIADYETTPRLIYIDDNEPVLFFYSPFDELIELYADDQSLLSSFTIPIEFQSVNPYSLYHVSRQLFDCDSTNIEYLISQNSFEESERYVQIIREDEEIIFDLPGHIFYNDESLSTNPKLGDAVIEVEDGVLFVFMNSAGNLMQSSKVFKSCGSIPNDCGCLQNGLGTVDVNEIEWNDEGYKVFPNPGSDRFTIEYELPLGENEGLMQIYDMGGQLMLEKRVGSKMKSIIIDSSEWSAGRYEVILRVNDSSVSRSYIELDR